MDNRAKAVLAAIVLYLLLKPKKASAGGGANIPPLTPGGNGYTPTEGAHGSTTESYIGIPANGRNRGIRNNNPTNIRYYAINNWLGKIPYSQNQDYNATTGQTEKKFEQFVSYPYGVRAAIYLLKNARIATGDNTVRKILNEWANNPGSGYINYVSNFVGVGPDDVLTADYTTLKKLTQAIARFENDQKATTDPEVVTDIQFDTAYYTIGNL